MEVRLSRALTYKLCCSLCCCSWSWSRKKQEQGSWGPGEEAAAKDLGGGKLKWEPVGKKWKLFTGDRAGRKGNQDPNAKSLASKTLVTTGLETLAACSN